MNSDSTRLPLPTKGSGTPLADLTDGQLLGRFASGQDEAALEMLMQRHGPLVLSVCGRQVPDRQGAEDVFLGTFQALADRAVRWSKRSR